jgi:hypothetical protein
MAQLSAREPDGRISRRWGTALVPQKDPRAVCNTTRKIWRLRAKLNSARLILDWWKRQWLFCRAAGVWRPRRQQEADTAAELGYLVSWTNSSPDHVAFGEFVEQVHLPITSHSWVAFFSLWSHISLLLLAGEKSETRPTLRESISAPSFR